MGNDKWLDDLILEAFKTNEKPSRDLFKEARKEIDRTEKRCIKQFSDVTSYLQTRADIMLELIFKRESEDKLYFGLKCRERPIYREKGTETDILELSRIVIPSEEEISNISYYKPDLNAKNTEKINFGELFSVKRDDLVGSLHALFSKIRSYENKKIMHEVGYTATGIGRKAHVSVTGIGALRHFDDIQTKKLPDVYHTMNNTSETIYLPSMSDGTILKIPREFYMV